MSPIKPIYETGFDQVEEGIHLFVTNELKKVTDDKGRTRLDLSAQVSGGSCDGMRYTHFFYIKGTASSKGDAFGQAQFLGWFNVSGITQKPKDEYDDDYLEKNIDKIISKAEGTLWGGEIEHRKVPNSEDLRANCKRFLTVKDAKVEIAKAGGASEEKDSSESQGEASGGSSDEDW